jgi:transposase
MGSQALATALAASRKTSGWLRSIPRPPRRCSAPAFPRDAKTWLPSVPERSRQPAHGLLRDLVPGGVAGTLSARRAARILRGIRPQGTSARLRRQLASEILREFRTLERQKEGRGPKWAHRSRGRSFRHHPHRDLRCGSHTGCKDHRSGRQCGALPDQGPLRLLLWHGAGRGLQRRGGSPQALAGRKPSSQQNALHLVAVCQARSHARGGAYYRKKIAEGKSRKEALRCLKRRISDAIFRSLLADSQAPSRSAA